jgi:hypothetical protein
MPSRQDFPNIRDIDDNEVTVLLMASINRRNAIRIAELETDNRRLKGEVNFLRDTEKIQGEIIEDQRKMEKALKVNNH